jgi:hypothetical protein
MRHKILIILFFLSANIYAQNYWYPYSIYGLGEPLEQNFVGNVGMGGLSMGWNDNYSYTPLNPASYSWLQKTSFNVSMNTQFKTLTQGDVSEDFNNSSFGYFSLGFPVGKNKKFGAAFGLSPVSKIGFYQIENGTPPNDSNTIQTEEYDYSGGFSKFYGGLSYKIGNNISVGANLYFMWGNTSLTHDLYFDNTSYINLETKKDLFYRNIGYDIGVQYKTKISDKWKLTTGIVYNFPIDLKVGGDIISQSYLKSGTTKYYLDSIKEIVEEDAIISKPTRLGVGFILQKENKYRIGFDYVQEFWSDFEDVNGASGLNDQTEFRLGAEFLPEEKGMNTYFNQITYRVGIKYVQTYLKVPENVDMNVLTDIDKISMSAGVGLPPVFLKKSKDKDNLVQKTDKNYSLVDLAVEVGMMGRDSGDIFNEVYYNIYIGLRLNDNWFRKSKIY